MSSLQPSVPINANRVITRPLHQSAIEQIKIYVDNFATSVVLQAKVLADKQGDDLVLKRHVDEATEFILSQKKRGWPKELLKIVGGALVGAFVPGLITAIPVQDTSSIIIYIGLGFAGLIMVFIGLII